MNNIIKIGIIALMGSMLFSCEQDPEKLEIVKPFEKSDDYYANLRAYKQSDHEKLFGWFGFWSATGASASNYLKSLPDSVDLVSIWGSWLNINDAQRQDIIDVRNQKGTKVIVTHLLDNLGEGLTPGDYTAAQKDSAVVAYWGWEGPYRQYADLTPHNEEIIRKYARMLAERAIEHGFDGFDIDQEPNVGIGRKPFTIGGFTNRMVVFVDELSKYFGPKSGTGRILAIDGELTSNVTRECGDCFDYFIAQAYGSYSDSGLDSRLSSVINFYSHIDPVVLAKRFIVTENFENIRYRENGGANFTSRDGKSMKSVRGMAQWKPMVNGVLVQKGGAGTFHMEYEYRNSEPYKYIIEAIQVMNPANNNK